MSHLSERGEAPNPSKIVPTLPENLPLGVDALALPFPLILEEQRHLRARQVGQVTAAIRPTQLDHEFEAVVGVLRSE